MAFFAYTGTDVREYPALNVVAQPGLVYDFGGNPNPGDGRWVSNAGPATGFTRIGGPVLMSTGQTPRMSGTVAARPQAAVFGEGFYYALDVDRLDYSNGSSWQNGVGTTILGSSYLLSSVAAATYAPLAAPALTGPATLGGVAIETTAGSAAKVATETSRAQSAEALLAPLASPALTGSATLGGVALETTAGSAAKAAAAQAAAIAASDPAGTAAAGDVTTLATATGRAVAFALVFGG